MDYTDAISSLTHLGTAVWAVFAALILVRLTWGQGIRCWAVGVYGLTIVLLYLASGTFHGLIYLRNQLGDDSVIRSEAVSSLWVAQRLDKSAIFALIAGSYTPVFVYLLQGTWRWGCLIAAWGIAAVGIALMWLKPDLRHEWLVGIYVGMGLVGLMPMRLYLPQVGWRGLLWVAALGAAYIGGAAIEVARWPTLVPGWVGPHELLHICDMLGTFIHFGFVMRFLVRQ